MPLVHESAGSVEGWTIVGKSGKGGRNYVFEKKAKLGA